MIGVSLRTSGNCSDLSGSESRSPRAILQACAHRVAQTVPNRREPSRHRLVGRCGDRFCQPRRNRTRPASLRPRGASKSRFVDLSHAPATRSTSWKAILAPICRSRQENSTPSFFCSGQISTASCPAKAERVICYIALGIGLLLAYHPRSSLCPSRSPGSACHGLS